MNVFKGDIRKDKKSSVRDLAKYIQNEAKQHDMHKDETNFYLNMTADNMEDAIKIMENTVRLSKRVKYPLHHLWVTFPDFESNEKTLPPEKLKAIITEFLQLIGYGSNQAICSVHYDTNNYHIHAEVNKLLIDPFGNVKSINPQMLVDRMQKAARMLEIKHNLSHDNGIYSVTEDSSGKKHIYKDKNRKYKKNKKPLKAEKKEAYSGSQSFITYLQQDVKPGLTEFNMENEGGWQSLHEKLASYNLVLKKVNNGLKIYDIDEMKSNLKAKGAAASKLGKFFSKSKLEEKYGEFEESNIAYDNTKIKYKSEQSKRVKSKDESKLYSLHKRFKEKVKQNKNYHEKRRKKEQEIKGKYFEKEKKIKRILKKRKQLEWKMARLKLGVQHLPSKSRESIEITAKYASLRVKKLEENKRQNQQELKRLLEQYPNKTYRNYKQYREWVKEHANNPDSPEYVIAKERLSYWIDQGIFDPEDDINSINPKGRLCCRRWLIELYCQCLLIQEDSLCSLNYSRVLLMLFRH